MLIAWQFLLFDEVGMSGEYVRITLAEVRERIESKGISEEEMRKSVYQDNPQYKKPDKGIERIIHRLYHSTSSDLEEELIPQSEGI